VSVRGDSSLAYDQTREVHRPGKRGHHPKDGDWVVDPTSFIVRKTVSKTVQAVETYHRSAETGRLAVGLPDPRHLDACGTGPGPRSIERERRACRNVSWKVVVCC
jgi:hypothetical protein